MKPSQAQPLPALMLSALGVVFGDIGTSPLYAFKEAFSPNGGLAPSPATVFPVLSMMFWAVTIVVSLKYVLIMLRFNHRGEGGVLALLARALTSVGERPRLAWIVAALGVFAASLFYGDAIITPAISVLSAVEGITLTAPQLHPLVVPLAISILCVLFILQRRGTARVGSLFGPVMLIWFVSLAALGINSIIESPDVLWAVDPRHALAFAINQPATMFMVLGAVFLTVTGAEAMFADLGHFGARPIRIGWFALVFPCLMLNYFGQAALVLREPEAVRNPFFLLAPDALLLPLVALATLATVIASQATISGAFSVTQQASRLNYLPRLKVSYTSETSQGQIYIPVVNWLLLAAVVLLVAGFRSSSNLAAAYGLAVSGDLAIGSVLLGMLILLDPRRRLRLLLIPMAFFFALEIGFLIANASKFIEGGWFPLAVALIMFTLLTTWKRGTEIIRARKDAMPRVRTDLSDMNLEGIARVPGSAVFSALGARAAPPVFCTICVTTRSCINRWCFSRWNSPIHHGSPTANEWTSSDCSTASPAWSPDSATEKTPISAACLSWRAAKASTSTWSRLLFSRVNPQWYRYRAGGYGAGDGLFLAGFYRIVRPPHTTSVCRPTGWSNWEPRWQSEPPRSCVSRLSADNPRLSDAYWRTYPLRYHATARPPG